MTEVTGDTLPKMLVERATLSAGQTAIREKGHGIWQSWTWREVADNVRAMALGLHQPRSRARRQSRGGRR